MTNYHVGDMVKVRLTKFTKDGNETVLCFAHGMITQLRNRSEIAFIQFLPLEDLEDRWCTFSVIEKAYT